MAVVTKTEIKALLSIATSDTSKDDLIEALIPTSIEYIRDHFNNDFYCIDTTTGLPWSYESDTMGFQEGAGEDPDVITDSEGGFDDLEIQANDVYRIDCQQSANHGKYVKIAGVQDGILTLSADDELTGEGAGDLDPVTLYRMAFPTTIKLVIAGMIKFDIQSLSMNSSDANIKSEDIGDYSVTYDRTNYPEYVFKSLGSAYKKIRFR